MKVHCLVYGFIFGVLSIDGGEICPLAARFGVLEKDERFRCDYQYREDIEGWLKYHEIPANWYNARLKCHLEGTTLASPLNHQLHVAIQNVAGQINSDSKEIFTGIHSTLSKGDYFSIEGESLSQIVHTWAQGEPDNYDDEGCLTLTPDGTLADTNCKVPRPFVCYKTHNESDVVNECGTIDDEYVISNVTGSCYKFHTVPRTWSQAHMVCAAEGGYLTIINSEAEADVVRKLFKKYPRSSLMGKFDKDLAFIGFHDWGEHGEFLTINGQTLKEAGYKKFSIGFNNNYIKGKYCGGIYRNALLNDLWCHVNYAFICEKNPASLSC